MVLNPSVKKNIIELFIQTKKSGDKHALSRDYVAN